MQPYSRFVEYDPPSPQNHVPGQHAEPGAHCPELLQVCVPVPTHWIEPGEQTPPHVPFEQTYGQVVIVCQVPVVLHDWARFPEHCIEPGAQETHAPFRQAGVEPEQPCVVCHEPLELHVCTFSPEH